MGLVPMLAVEAPDAWSHAIEARPDAALSGSFGVELRVDDASVQAATDAYVTAGSDKGLADETSLEVVLTLDPTALQLTSPIGRAGRLPFLRLSQTNDPATARVLLELNRAPEVAWTISAWTLDEASGAFLLAGEANLLADGEARARLELRWSSSPGQPGSLRLVREDGPGRRTVLIERKDLDNGSQSAGAVQLGTLAADPLGLVGRLSIDDIQVSRVRGARDGR